VIDDDAKTIIRTLRDALLDVRGYVAERDEAFRAALLEGPAERSGELLERVDGAIAEAHEVLS
jgi:hypothetical protein